MNLLSVVLIVLAAIALFAWMGLQSILIYLTIQKRIASDVTSSYIPIPKLVEPAIKALTQLGFHHLGDVQIKLPFQAGPVTEWVFLNSAGTTAAAVIPSRRHSELVQFSTHFPDKSVVETSYPLEESIENPDFRSHGIPTSIADAYRFQVQQIQDWSQKHGEPTRRATMEAWLEGERSYSRRYSQRKLQRMFRLGLVEETFSVYAVWVLLFALAIYPALDPQVTPQEQAQWIVVLTSPAVLIFAVVALFVSRKRLGSA